MELKQRPHIIEERLYKQHNTNVDMDRRSNIRHRIKTSGELKHNKSK